MTITDKLKLIKSLIEQHISDYSDSENEKLEEVIKTVLAFDV